MRTLLLLFTALLASLAILFPTQAQWRCLYVTYDDATNGTGYNTTSVGLLTEDTFVALVMTTNQWSFTHDDQPLRVINLPDGVYRGTAVTPDGRHIFIVDYEKRKISKDIGSPTTGNMRDSNFTFRLGTADSVSGAAALPSVIDVAKWNFRLSGGYNLRSNGTVPGNASGHTSVYDIAVDAKGNVYTQSHLVPPHSPGGKKATVRTREEEQSSTALQVAAASPS